MSQPSDMGRDVGVAVAKAFPPLTVWSLTMNEWVAIATLLYIALQAAYLAWKWIREATARLAEEDVEP